MKRNSGKKRVFQTFFFSKRRKKNETPRAKFRQKPGNKIALIPLRTMLKEAYKEDLDQLFPKQPTVTEADDETAEKEVNIIAKEVVSGAPPLAETGAALDAEPKSNL